MITRPSKANYSKILKFKPINVLASPLASPLACTVACTVASPTNPDLASHDSHKVDQIMEHIKPENMMNIKEMRSLLQLDDLTVLPKDLFNTVCDNIIKELINHDKIVIPAFRDTIYDILISS